MAKVLFVEHCADDFLGGTANMDAMTELAYRRICDLIYSTNDNLLDNDSLQYATKAGAKWKKIRQELIEVYGKIYIENGFIRQKTCQEKLEKARRNIEQKSIAGQASAYNRKPLKHNKTRSTAVDTAVSTPEPTSVPTNQEPNNHLKEKTKKKISFGEWYPHYPRKVAKGDAEKAWMKAEVPENIIALTQSYARSISDRDREFIPYPATWLNAQRWEDEGLDGVESKPVDLTDWPEWRREIAGALGTNVANTWFKNADRQGNKLIVSKKFDLDRIRERYAIELGKIGITEILGA